MYLWSFVLKPSSRHAEQDEPIKTTRRTHSVDLKHVGSMLQMESCRMFGRGKYLQYPGWKPEGVHPAQGCSTTATVAARDKEPPSASCDFSIAAPSRDTLGDATAGSCDGADSRDVLLGGRATRKVPKHGGRPLCRVCIETLFARCPLCGLLLKQKGIILPLRARLLVFSQRVVREEPFAAGFAHSPPRGLTPSRHPI